MSDVNYKYYKYYNTTIQLQHTSAHSEVIISPRDGRSQGQVESLHGAMTGALPPTGRRGTCPGPPCVSCSRGGREVTPAGEREEPAPLELGEGVQAGTVAGAGRVESVAGLTVLSWLTGHTAGGGAASWTRGVPPLTPPAGAQQQQQHGESGECHLGLGLTNTGLVFLPDNKVRPVVVVVGKFQEA